MIGISEFVPITNNSYSPPEKRDGKQYEMNENLFDSNNEKEVSLDSQYPNMFAKLDKIAELNNRINPVVKYKTLNKELSDKLKDYRKEDPTHLDTFIHNGIDSDIDNKPIYSRDKLMNLNDGLYMTTIDKKKESNYDISGVYDK